MKLHLHTLLLALLATACGTQPEVTDYTRLVDPRIGTGDHGHVFFGANLPFGAIQLGPTSIPETWDWCSGYNDADSTVIGFGHTHLSGTGIGDLNDVSLLPVVGDVTFGRGNEADEQSGQWSYVERSTEHCEPGYYRGRLLRYGVEVELTATTRVGLSRYTFPAEEAGGVILDLENGQGWDDPTECSVRVVDNQTLEGYRHSTGWAKAQKCYFRIVFSRPFTQIQYSDNHLDAMKGQPLYTRVDFAPSEEPLLVKCALSAVSTENAALNMEAECPAWDFDAVRAAAHDRWNEALAKVGVKTDDERTARIFYTALYHTMIAPSIFSDVNGDYLGADGAVHNDAEHEIYTTFSLWDTYRAAHPLMTLIHPERMPAIITTMLHIFDEQGKLPVWHLMGNETDCMVGNPAIPVVADALLKGVEGFDPEHAYEAMRRSAMLDERGLDLLKKYGYIPYEFNESVGHCMEYAIADGALARAAEALGHDEDADYFTRRSHAYRHYFDPSIRFIRARSADGAWRDPFDPFHSRHMAQDYTEGNAWQYTWLVPHDVDGLVDCFGSKEAFLEKLDSLFVVEGFMGAEASPDISGLIGQYAHGNEPSHHVAYLYTVVGEPARTAEIVRRVMAELYDDQPAGLCGNEDVGQMSAWYVLSAMGLYQVEPAGGRYWFGSPAVDSATIQPGDKPFTIEAVNNSPENIYIQRVTLNGAPYTKRYIDYADLKAGGTLRFEMGATPADWSNE